MSQLNAERPHRRRHLLDLCWFVGHVARLAPRLNAVWAVADLGRGLLVPAQLWLTKLLVDALAVEPSGAVGGGVAGGGATPWVALLALLGGALLAERALGGAQTWVQAAVGERTGSALQHEVMQRAARLDLATFEHQEYYDRANRVMSSAETRGPQLLQRVFELVRSVPMVAGYAAGVAALSPVLLGVILAARVPSVLSFYLGGRAQWRLYRDQTFDRRLGEYHASVLTDRAFAKEVRLYGLAGYFLDRWRECFWRTRDEQRRVRLRIDLRQRATLTVSTAVMLSGLLWIAAAGAAGATPGTYALLFQSMLGLTQVLFTLSAALGALGEQSGYGTELRAFLRRPVSERAAAGRAPRRALPRPLTQGICFDDVWFTYPGSGRPALAGVSLQVKAGEKVALVGENGAGKTTLVKLLLGLYQPDAGRVTFDGHDVRELDTDSLRAAIAAVFQQFVRFQLTLRENVAIGALEGASGGPQAGDPARVSAALSQAGVDALAAGLPHGVETLLGPDVGGVDLSGGQWQRLALARAFLRDAEVLVLDEPTAALDPLAELAVFERFVELARGRTAVLISHRLGMARLADRVLVLRDGRLVEDGTHEELVRAGREYAALFSAQARWYV